MFELNVVLPGLFIVIAFVVIILTFVRIKKFDLLLCLSFFLAASICSGMVGLIDSGNEVGAVALSLICNGLSLLLLFMYPNKAA